MPRIPATYEVRAAFPLKMQLPVAPRGLAPVQLPWAGALFDPRVSDVRVAFEADEDDAGTVIVEWLLEDEISDESVNGISHETGWQQDCRMSSGSVHLPGWPEDRSRYFRPVDVSYEMAFAALLRVGLLAGTPHLAGALTDSFQSPQASATVRVRGTSLERVCVSDVFGLSVRPRGTDLPTEQARAAMTEAPLAHEYSILLAENGWLKNDLRSAILHLATALETAAYEFEFRTAPVGTYSSIDDVGDFQWKSFLPEPGSHNVPPGVASWLSRQGAGLARAAREGVGCLWESRNELVHYGRAQRRPHDFKDRWKNLVRQQGIAGEVARARIRAQLPRLEWQDYKDFRAALTEALVWMGLPRA